MKELPEESNFSAVYPLQVMIVIRVSIGGHIMDGNNRENIKPGTHVLIIQKQDQRTEKLTEGIVKDILTSSSTHPHGIKVRLINGIVGRVKQILLEQLPVVQRQERGAAL
jgi:uncharacterized repeat protein (TIGR03833 family)